MYTNFDPFSKVPEVKMGELFGKPITVVDYAVVPGHTRPGGSFIRKDYVTRHIVILLRVNGKEVRVKTDSRNLENTLSKFKNKLPIETTICKTSWGPRFTKPRRVH